MTISEKTQSLLLEATEALTRATEHLQKTQATYAKEIEADRVETQRLLDGKIAEQQVIIAGSVTAITKAWESLRSLGHSENIHFKHPVSDFIVLNDNWSSSDQGGC